MPGPDGRPARPHTLGWLLDRALHRHFGHAFYRRVKPLAAAERAFTGVMLDHPLPALTSFALVVLRRPDGAGGSGREQVAETGVGGDVSQGADQAGGVGPG